MKFWVFLVCICLFSLACQPDEPTPPPLKAAFSVINNNCQAPCEIQFINESSSASLYSWNFGDGNTSEEQSPTHRYAFGGEYTVVLQITNEAGETEQAVRKLRVEAELPFITGMDLAYQPFFESSNVPFYDQQGNEISDFVDWSASNGVNMVRLRLFHTPDPSDNFGVTYADLHHVLAYAKRIKAAGQQFMLDFHYSDTWADPAKQFTPKAWENLTFFDLKDSLYQYTRRVLRSMGNEGVLPDMIQIGNENNLGMLWPQGKIDWNNEASWGKFAELVLVGDLAVREVEQEFQQDIQTLVHYAGIENAPTFFTKVTEQGAAFDVIGLSHYSFFHTTNTAVIQVNLRELANTFDKPILIVETSYPFTLGWNDFTHNVAGLEEHLIPNYPASPTGQKEYFEFMIQILKNLPNDRGKGFVWWAPDFIAFDGSQSPNGSGFENVCVFDFDSKALPVMDVFREN